jgi:rhamnogalacturonan endolyase
VCGGTPIHCDWNYNNSTTTRVLNASECSSNNGTKSTPTLSADILGDWREEVIWRTTDNTALHIYTTTIPATNRLYTLMHDRQYRLAIAWQNVGYNQPPHPSFYPGDGMAASPIPNIILVGGSQGGTIYPSENAFFGNGAVF